MQFCKGSFSARRFPPLVSSSLRQLLSADSFNIVKQTWLTMRASRFCLVVYLQLLFLFVDLFINSFGELFRTADVVLLVLYMWVNLLLLSILSPWVFTRAFPIRKNVFTLDSMIAFIVLKWTIYWGYNISISFQEVKRGFFSHFRARLVLQ